MMNIPHLQTNLQAVPWLITIDVEALPARASAMHVDRLIYGRFAGHQEIGIRQMMDEAEKNNQPLTFFFDYCEYDCYGETYLDIAREISTRGHSLQLHAHPELMSEETWHRFGLEKPCVPMNEFSVHEANALCTWLMDLHYRASARAPVAFRGGGYRYNMPLLNALQRYGVTMSSSHNSGRQNQMLPYHTNKMFAHINGVLELPISVLQQGEIRCECNFNAYGFEKNISLFLESFADIKQTGAILNLVMHSRSFLYIQKQPAHFTHNGLKLFHLYRSMLNEAMSKRFQAIMIENVPEYYKKFESPLAPEEKQISVQREVKNSPQIISKISHPRQPEQTLSPVMCSLCKNPSGKFESFNNRKKAKCCHCGALERQRTLVKVWEIYLKKEISITGKSGLLIAPAKSEKIFFKSIGLINIKTLDVRPQSKCNIVADICNMPQISDNSFDFIFASHVLPHVHDLAAAMGELNRILTPEGIFLSYTPTQKGMPTYLLSEEENSNWYGETLLREYKVGTFRKFGDLGLLQELQKKFVTKTFFGTDPVTGVELMWVCAWKPEAALCVRKIP